MTDPTGSGPGTITRDGCAVDLYRRFPVLGEPELIHDNLPPGARVLDLGAGVGRIADPLVALGHHVVAVDDSPEMLSRLQGARPVCSRIETLHLPEQFDGVVMASHLANTPTDEERHALYGAARRHVAPTGMVLVEWHTPEWFDSLEIGTTEPSALGDVTSWLQVHATDAGGVDATVTYALGDSTWTQRFQARRFTEPELRADLAACDLAFDGYLTETRSWFRARPVSRP
jgi:SAM-dependent methyltransferase